MEEEDVCDDEDRESQEDVPTTTMTKSLEETDAAEEEKNYRAWVAALKDETLTEYAQRQFDGSLNFSLFFLFIFTPLFSFLQLCITVHIFRSTAQTEVCPQQSPEDERHCHAQTERRENGVGRTGNVRRPFEG